MGNPELKDLHRLENEGGPAILNPVADPDGDEEIFDNEEDWESDEEEDEWTDWDEDENDLDDEDY